MSIVAEFAASLHEQNPPPPDRALASLDYPSRDETISDIRAVICDVYGTLVNYWKKDFLDPVTKEAALRAAFDHTADYFGMTDMLRAMNPGEPPAKTLSDLYHSLIALNHEKLQRKGIAYPEVRIEELWRIIGMFAGRYGFRPDARFGSERECAQCMAYYYNFHALGRGLYPGVVDALVGLHEKHVNVGVVSNAQFYTPIDLTLFVRDQSAGRHDDFSRLFDPDLVYFSYEYECAKPGRDLYEKLFNALYEHHILPSQTVYVGNDLVADIAPAQEIGMKTALFTGDAAGVFLHDMAGTIIPDITFAHWASLPERISFHEK